jgi:hypothetical protein
MGLAERDDMVGRTQRMDPINLAATPFCQMRLESDARNYEQVHGGDCVEWLRRKVSHPREGEGALNYVLGYVD